MPSCFMFLGLTIPPITDPGRFFEILLLQLGPTWVGAPEKRKSGPSAEDGAERQNGTPVAATCTAAQLSIVPAFGSLPRCCKSPNRPCLANDNCNSSLLAGFTFLCGLGLAPSLSVCSHKETGRKGFTMKGNHSTRAAKPHALPGLFLTDWMNGRQPPGGTLKVRASAHRSTAD